MAPSIAIIRYEDMIRCSAVAASSKITTSRFVNASMEKAASLVHDVQDVASQSQILSCCFRVHRDDGLRTRICACILIAV